MKQHRFVAFTRSHPHHMYRDITCGYYLGYSNPCILMNSYCQMEIKRFVAVGLDTAVRYMLERVAQRMAN
jgi:hypothetical protein